MPIEFDRTPSWRRYLRFWGSNPRADVDAELRFHIESRVEELIAAGYAEEEARRATEQRLGDLEAVRASCERLIESRETNMRRSEWWSELRQDWSYGGRSLRRAPAFAVVAIASLAVGIGATTAIFGLLHAILFERLPLPRPEQLVEVAHVIQMGPTTMGTDFMHSDFDELARLPGISLTLSTSTMATVAVADDREYASVQQVSGNYFETLGVQPMLGRMVSAEDDRSALPVVVVSAGYWRRHFAGERNAVGRIVTINGAGFTLIGVAEESYRGITFPGSFDVAIPLSSARHAGFADPRESRNRGLLIFGRLADVASLDRVQSEMQRTFSACCEKFNRRFGREFIELRDMSRGRTSPKFDARDLYGRLLWTLLAGVLVFLMIACANVGTLMLARTEQRGGELAVRLSLGATRGRLIRQLLTESLQIGLIGALLGFVLARWGLTLLRNRVPDSEMQLLQTVELGTDPLVLGFAIGITLLCSMLFGVLPAFRATRVDLAARAQQATRRVAGRRNGRLDRALIGAQVALALLLVSMAALLVQTLRNLQQVDAGFNRSNLLVASVETRGSTYERDGIGPIHAAILESTRSIPGITSAAMVSLAPVHGGRTMTSSIDVPGYIVGPDEDATAHFNAVTPGFFETARVVLRAGRDFSSEDQAASEPVAIVSEDFVNRFFGNRDPVGATIIVKERQTRVIGVAANIRYEDPREAAPPMIYVPVTQYEKLPFLVLLARTDRKPLAAANALQHELKAVAPGIRIERMVDMQRAMDDLLLRERMIAGLALLFGTLALGLAAVGVYGVTAYHITGRTAEIGIRRALGAPAPGVLWLVLRQTMITLVIGALVGVPLALLAGRAIATQLYDIEPFDLLSLGGALAILLATGMVAGLVPARRATHIDPLDALRAN